MLNIKETEKQKIFFTSDLHFGDIREFVWKSRGQDNIENHTIEVINIINDTILPKDILFVLGDFCLNTTIEQFHVILKKIKCKNLLYISGNHNNPHERNIYRKLVDSLRMSCPSPFLETECYPIKYQNFTYIGNYKEAILNGQFVVMCHYPIFIWNEMQNSSWMLCGHSHCRCPETKANNKLGKILDVGWDEYKRPLSFSEVSDIMSSKEVDKKDYGLYTPTT